MVDADTSQIVDRDSVSYDRSTIEKRNSNKDLDKKKYIVVVQVFSSESNALSYINKEYIHSLIREGPLKIASAIFNVTHLKNYKFFR